MLMTTNNPDEVGMSEELKVSINEDGVKTYVFTQSEYYDEESDEISSEPTYVMREEYAFDAAGNIVRNEMYEMLPG